MAEREGIIVLFAFLPFEISFISRTYWPRHMAREAYRWRAGTAVERETHSLSLLHANVRLNRPGNHFRHRNSDQVRLIAFDQYNTVLSSEEKP